MKIIEQAGRLPHGSTVSKMGEKERFILLDRLPAYDFGKNKQEETPIAEGWCMLAVNTQFGLGSLIPNSLELVWHRS